MPGELQYELIITINPEPDSDSHTLSQDSEYLLEELRYVDFEELRRATAGSSPAGTRAPDAVTIGTFVGVLSSPVVLRSAAAVIQSWLERKKQGSVTLKIGDDSLELSSASSRERAALVESFLRRHNSIDDV
jgi:hypothetical protein